ncbi:Hsp20/alpha crystallin family protein [Oligoflexus sp.]
MPAGINAQDIEAQYENGVLTVPCRKQPRPSAKK